MKDKNRAAFNLPYSPIRQVPPGHILYVVSGHTGVDIPTKTASPDIVEQTTRLFRNLADTLQLYGLGFRDVVKATVFLTDIDNHYQVVNDAFATYFEDPKPARTVVGVFKLPPVANNPLLIEVDVEVAIKPH